MKHIALLSIFSLIILTSCSAGDTGSASTNPLLDESLSEYIDISNLTIDDFAGPYAEQFLQFTVDSKNAFVTKVLQDSQVSEVEFEETKQIFHNCFINKGFTHEYRNGEYLIGPSKNDPSGNSIDAAVTSCESSSGFTPIEYLYKSTRSNPNNVPVEEAIWQCLITHRQIPRDYTLAEFRIDDANGTGIMEKFFDKGKEISSYSLEYSKCMINPYDLLPDE